MSIPPAMKDTSLSVCDFSTARLPLLLPSLAPTAAVIGFDDEDVTRASGTSSDSAIKMNDPAPRRRMKET